MATRQTLIDAIALKKDGTVQIAVFGTFSVETRPARTGRNPRTGEAISVPERRGIKFLPAGRLLDAIS